MDKNAIKKYAVWARRELISRVSQKALQYGISDKDIVPANATSVNGVVLSAEELKQRKALIEQINSKGYEQVMEEVAYTWFNRFSALRFMEVNGYLPSHVRVFTDEENNFKPQILAEAINLELDGLDMEKVYYLKDANDNDALFKYLVIVQCNALNPIMPGMFQRISDYTELLFPDNLLREGSVIQQMIEMIPEEDWKDAVQIIGWLYQFYNIEPKAEVFSKSGRLTKEEVPAATQLFTPDWIVRYMVENSLGRLWIEGHPNDELKSEWKYYLEEAEQEADVQEHLAAIRKEYAAITPEQIKCIDPCSGSGHICAYIFDVLVQIYEVYGYTAREAVRSIVENNIYGLDIDERAAQLAYFAVMMKARQYDRRFLTRKDENGNPDVPQPHIHAIVESNGIDTYALDYFVNGNPKLKAAINSIMKEMRDAKEYGSILNITPVDFAALYTRFDEVRDDISMSREVVLSDILPLVKVAETLACKYNAVITNPPYMKADNMSPKLLDYVLNYKVAAKYDLYSTFIYKCHDFACKNGFVSMITMHNFMFAPSFLEMRDEIKQWSWVNMIHLGSRAFSEISGEVVQTAAYVTCKRNTKTLLSVVDVTTEKTPERKEAGFFENKGKPYFFNLMNIDVIPCHAFGYALSEKVINLYESGKILDKYGVSKAGVVTGADDVFVRFWFEVDNNEITYLPEARRLYKYVLFSKGGTFNKWYGNSQNVLRLEDMWDDNKTNKSVRRGDVDFYYRRGIGWSQMGGGVHKAFSEITNSVCKTTTPMLYVHDQDKFNYIFGFLNSKIPPKILKSLNPTLSILTSDIMNLPFLYDVEYKEEIDGLVDECISFSKRIYEEYEENWQFSKHCLIMSCSTLAQAYEKWKRDNDDTIAHIQENEKKINTLFVKIMGLRDEIEDSISEVELLSKRECIVRLLHYAVGCMFGRYSLDVEGIAYAGGEWDDSKYVTFKADKDSIIPICDDEYFSDDIVGRFVRFIEVVYGKETLNENLRFIADALGGSGQPKEVIRNYFLNDFYADHLKIYQKRPIYWLFDSGKKNGFKTLVYMHRYAPDTIARMRTDYVHEQQSRYRTAIADLEQRIASASTSERVKLNKKLKTLQEQSAEIQGYEEKIHHLADQYISIDLDDGVKKNYEIFKNVLAKIK